MRLFALGELTPPAAVAGTPREAVAADRALLTRWRAAFADEATHGWRGARTPAQVTAGAFALGYRQVLWERAGEPVGLAVAGSAVAGASRIGPVYTPPAHRGRGYGSAVTAAAAAAALADGARHVVLFTDLANPVSNAIYPRIGFRPVLDAVEVAFRR
nr:GNAT family N-acetyltransferase [Pseudonocardia acidicola]